MIKVSVFYPHKEGAHFDIDYYAKKHVPMVRQLLGAACKGAAVEQGFAGGAPGAPPTYVAMGHLMFDSVEAFQKAHAGTFVSWTLRAAPRGAPLQGTKEGVEP